MVFPWFFLQFGLGGAGVQIVETRIFLRGTVMKASSHEKHSKQQWKKQKKSSDPWARSGRGLAGDMGLNFLFFWFFHGFLQFGQKPREHKKKKFRPMGKVWAIHTQTKKPKNQKTKNQETKKPKNQKNKKNKIAHPKGRGSDAECWVLSFCFFCFFWFFGFLVFCFFVFLFFWFFGLCVDSHCRCAKQRLPGTVSGCTRGRAGKNQKTKKPRNQETKKPKNQKNKKNKKNKIAHPKGGQMQSVGSCLFVFFCFFGFLFFCFFGFLFFCFFGFLVCVWIAIADVPSRDCQALSVVALEARSIHYSTAMFAMT